MLPTILRKPIRWVMTLALKKARPSRPCPFCGAAVPKPSSVTDDLWNMLVVCPSCQLGTSVFAAGDSEIGALEIGAAPIVDQESRPSVSLPPDTMIQHSVGDDRSQSWSIPAKGGCNFFLIFGVVWLLFTSFFAFGTVNKGGNLHTDFGSIGLVLFLGVFFVVGIAVFWIGVLVSRMSHRLNVGNGLLRYEKRLFGRSKQLVWAVDTVDSVELKEFYQQNYKPVHGIEIKGSEGKIRFGSQLSQPEKSILARQLQDALVVKSAHSETSLESSEITPETPGNMATVDERAGRITIYQPGKIPTVFLVIGIIFMIVGIFGTLMSTKTLSSFQKNDGDTISNIFSLFSLGATLVPALFALIGIILLFVVRQMKRTDRTIEVDLFSVKLTERIGNKTMQQSWPASDVRRAIVVPLGKVNNNQCYRGEILLADSVLPFGWSKPKAELIGIAMAINRLLEK